MAKAQTIKIGSLVTFLWGKTGRVVRRSRSGAWIVETEGGELGLQENMLRVIG